MTPLTDVAPHLMRQWMKAALDMAVTGVAEGESPFGAAVIDPSGKQLSVACNRVRSQHDPSAHAEVLAIAAACKANSTLRLKDCWLVATGEPCLMCAANAATAGIGKIIFGAPSSTIEAAGYQSLGCDLNKFLEVTNARFDVYGPVLEDDCAALLLNHPKGSS